MEIINYKLRQSIGKPIGSGIMEKTVDMVIAKRQKSKGMSWSTQGSRSLAVLEITIRNDQWKKRWVGLPRAA
ncbi:MAG: hypothetical protein Q8858_02080 [Bacteroidota bacterium]|nr:hypothetical protein [Bacteroidota bacterium]MDP4197438.1 hypothetical protein [Bacteroidota bacterium]